MDTLIAFFRLYALAGLVLSLAVHIAALLGLTPVDTDAFFTLHAAIFPLWLFVIVTLNRTFGPQALRRPGFWKRALAGCPVWLKGLTYGFFAYAVVNFVWFLIHAPPRGAHVAAPAESVLRGFSGHWMAFYSLGLAVLTSVAAARARRTPDR